jgi:hypothetical protein
MKLGRFSEVDELDSLDQYDPPSSFGLMVYVTILTVFAVALYVAFRTAAVSGWLIGVAYALLTFLAGILAIYFVFTGLMIAISKARLPFPHCPRCIDKEYQIILMERETREYKCSCCETTYILSEDESKFYEVMPDQTHALRLVREGRKWQPPSDKPPVDSRVD